MDRFWDKVDASGDCWEWTAARHSAGYGVFGVDQTVVYAHRFSWTTLVGPIPKGMHIDHLCRNPGCVNPDHLEPVTRRVNILRGFSPMALQAARTSCLKGHVFDESNTYIRKDTGDRQCRECQRDRNRACYERKRLARAS